MAKQTTYTCDSINADGTDCNQPAKWEITAQMVQAPPKGATTVVHVNPHHSCNNYTHLGEVAYAVLRDDTGESRREAEKYSGSRPTPWQHDGVNIRKVVL